MSTEMNSLMIKHPAIKMKLIVSKRRNSSNLANKTIMKKIRVKI